MLSYDHILYYTYMYGIVNVKSKMENLVIKTVITENKSISNNLNRYKVLTSVKC